MMDMLPSHGHTVKSFDVKLQKLGSLIVTMGDIAKSQIDDAVIATKTRNPDLAAQVLQRDRDIDDIEKQIDSEAVNLLATRQPMASDLRMIVSALHMATNLERIGDYAANIAKRAIAIVQTVPVKPEAQVERMAQRVVGTLDQVMEAFIEQDSSKAHDAWSGDEELDEMYNSIFREHLTYMMEDPRSTTSCIHKLFIAKNLERIGDHATNIAERVYFIIEGTQMPGVRPKGDNTSFQAPPTVEPSS
jgi:phosphate transport system protein